MLGSSCIGNRLVIVRTRLGPERVSGEELVHQQKPHRGRTADELVEHRHGLGTAITQPIRLPGLRNRAIGVFRQPGGLGRAAGGLGTAQDVEKPVYRRIEEPFGGGPAVPPIGEQYGGLFGGLRRLQWSAGPQQDQCLD